MSRSASKVLLLALLTVAGWGGLWLYEARSSAGAEKTQAAASAEEKSARLRGIAGRLDLDARVARVIVTDQQPTAGAGGVPRTTLLWMEYTRDRRDLLPARRFVLEGTAARVTGKVVRIQGGYAVDNAPLAGHSLLLFTGIAGDKQPGTTALPIDPPGRTPDVYKGADPRLAEVEAPHWQDFWKLAQDPQYRATAGVQVIEAEGALPEGFRRGVIHTVTLSAEGKLDIQTEPADADELRAVEESARRAGVTARMTPLHAQVPAPNVGRVAKLNRQTPPADAPLPLARGAAMRDAADNAPRPTPAPAWAALLAPWLGLVVLVTSIVFVLLPGSADPRAELQHARDYSPADKFLPFPIYGVALALFVGIVVLWQMRREPRPLPAPLQAQRVQAWVGIVLALLGAAVIYGWVAVRGPR